MFSKIPAV
jgi:hypothetical protein